MPVSRIVAERDAELARWREFPLGACPILYLDARDEKVRSHGIVRHVAALAAIGVRRDGRRRVLGVSVAPAEAEPHWRAFFDHLVQRGLHGVAYVVSDDHAGLRRTGRAVFTAAIWQLCQFHPSQNAIQHAPTVAIRKCIGRQLQDAWDAWDAPDIATAEGGAGHARCARRAYGPPVGDLAGRERA